MNTIPDPKNPNNKMKITKLLEVLSITILLTLSNNLCEKSKIYVEGWAVGPTQYVFSIENAMENGILNVHCKSNNDDLGLVRLPVQNNYTHELRTEFFNTISFFCELMVPDRNYIVFDTFRDVIEFVDQECGGRHCFWKACDDGIYLYHIQKHKYILRHHWGSYPPDHNIRNKFDGF